ncbi:MAG: dihydrofolate reductase [bacterium]
MKNNKEINIIVAKSINNIIGNNNKLPWYIPDDLKRFKNITSNNIVVMGRKTFESIGKPLPNRVNYVISKNHKELNKEYLYNDDIIFFKNIEDSIDYFVDQNKYNKMFVIGGNMLYRYFINNNLYDKIYLTEIENIFNGDTYFPEVDINKHNKFTEKKSKYNGLFYEFNTYTKKCNY